MDAEIKNAIRVANKEAQYDEKAKRLLGHKYILAYILVNTVDEFKGMHPKDVVSYIEGEPLIGVVPVENGMTNTEKEKQGQRVVGFNSENSEINEGLVRFDIVFYVRMKDGISQIIVNVEAQKDTPAEYKILNRAIFYVSRLISSQKERDFANTNYDDIKRVFSIWICMNRDQNSMHHVHLTNDELLGSCEWEGKLGLFNIILIGLSKELPKYDKRYELHRLLGALLSKEISADDKINIVEKEYDIPVEGSIREDMNVMCNLSQGIKEEGIAIGEARGEARGEANFILNMHKKGYTLEQIADVAEKSVEEIKAIIEERESVLV